MRIMIMLALLPFALYGILMLFQIAAALYFTYALWGT